jgi:hypothetical protein
LVADGEGFGIGLLHLPKLEEACLTDAKPLLDLSALEKTLRIGLQKKGNLLIGEPFVELGHGCLLTPKEAASMGVRFSNENGSPLKSWIQLPSATGE